MEESFMISQYSHKSIKFSFGECKIRVPLNSRLNAFHIRSESDALFLAIFSTRFPLQQIRRQSPRDQTPLNLDSARDRIFYAIE